MKNLVIVLIIVVGVNFSCSSSKDILSTDETQKIEELRTAIESKSFKFAANFAYPLQSNDVILVTDAVMAGSQNIGGQVNLSGNNDYLKLDGENTEGDLSYFGEMRNVGYNDIADNSIIFSGPHKDFQIEEKKNGDKIIIQFDANNQVEEFRVRMVVFNSYKSNVIIYGSNRTAIRYTGRIELLEE